MKADGAHPQTGRTGRALRNPNSTSATDSFPEFILGWMIGELGLLNYIKQRIGFTVSVIARKNCV
jgi:hypothetical protein